MDFPLIAKFQKHWNKDWNIEQKMSNPVCCYDFTLRSSDAKHDDIIGWLTKETKKWCFQKEKGESGYEHFQGRFSLKVKTRLDTLKKSIPWQSIHLSPTSKDNSKNMFYVMKADTRIEGPWSSETHEEPPYIPRQVREIQNWRPWQQAICMLAKVWDTRGIHCIVDGPGNKGKSVLVSALGAARQACNIPFCNDYKDILRMVMDRPKRGIYLIDMPKAINKEKLFQLFSAIETVKSGYAYDDRYSFKEEYFDSPNIFVFTNKLPDTSMLSADRWRIWGITSHKFNLVPYEQLEQANAAEMAQAFKPNIELPLLVAQDGKQVPLEQVSGTMPVPGQIF